MRDDETHNDIEDNLVRSFWGHAQIEEENADFQETVGDQSMEGQGSLGKPYPKATVINNTKTKTNCKTSIGIHQKRLDGEIKYEPSRPAPVELV